MNPARKGEPPISLDYGPHLFAKGDEVGCFVAGQLRTGVVDFVTPAATTMDRHVFVRFSSGGYASFRGNGQPWLERSGFSPDVIWPAAQGTPVAFPVRFCGPAEAPVFQYRFNQDVGAWR